MKKKIGVVLALVLLFPVVFIFGAVLLNGRTQSDTHFQRSAMLAAPPKPLRESVTLKVVTFNVQDLIPVGKNRPERMRAIGAILTELDPDIVGFQEAFIRKDREILLDALAGSRLRYYEYFPSATVGSGKLIVSAFPVVEAWFHRYTQSNCWYDFKEGDWWAGKGVGLARLELPHNLGYLDFYDTHLQAGYPGNGYETVRQAQVFELAGFVKDSATGTSPALVVGDMNYFVGSPEHQIAVEAGWERLMTIDSGIDHIFAMNNPRYRFEVLDTIAIERDIPVAGGTTPLSDHRGYMTTLRITPLG